ncbi:MAG: class I SAM-dependent methyltransferase [Pelagimonas sp.]|nr:class I SAM-dependent methyltransferase [Pelagimonas sp.]
MEYSAMGVLLKSILKGLDPLKGSVRAVLPQVALGPIERNWKSLQARRIAQEPDRVYLRDVILPEMSKTGARRILFVGVRAYTADVLIKMDQMGFEIWTTDIDPEAAQFVPKSLPRGRHVLADITAPPPPALPDRFDFILMNGVFGYGVNAPAQCALAFGHMVGMLRAGGLLLVGWNPERCPNLTALALDAGLRACDFPDHPGHMSFRESTHVFDLYARAKSA